MVNKNIYFISLLFLTSCAGQSVKKNFSTVEKSPKANPIFRQIAAVPSEKLSGTCRESKESSSHSQVIENLNACIKQNEWKKVEKWAEKISRNEPSSPWGAYYLSLASEQQKELEKALWLSELAIKKDSSIGLLHYHHARLLHMLGQENQALKEFQISVNLDPQIAPAQEFLGVQSYLQNKCSSAIKHFKNISMQSPVQESSTIAYSECLAKTGEIDLALQILENQNKFSKNQQHLMLQQGRIFETYKRDSLQARSVYENLLKKTTNADLKVWLGKKINFLKSQTQITQVQGSDL